MDNMKILKRAWNIVWNYRSLWIFGLLLAMTVGGTTIGRIGSNSGYRYNTNPNFQNSVTFPAWAEEQFRSPQTFMEALGNAGRAISEAIASELEVSHFLPFLIIFLVFMVMIGIGVKILGYVSETAVIRMVDEYEATSRKVSIKEGFQFGWSLTSWRLFLIDLLTVSLPALVFISILVSLIWGSISLGFNFGSNQGWIFSIAILFGLLILTLFLFSMYFIVIGLLRNFFVRTCALEKVGVRASIQNGFTLVRDNWKEIGLFWLILIGAGLAWAILSTFLIILLIPLLIGSVVLAGLVASIPGLFMGGLASIFLPGTWSVVVGILFGLPVFILLAGAPILFFEGLVQIFKSASWTLVYRELKTNKDNLISGEKVELVVV